MEKIETPLTWILAIVILGYLATTNNETNNESTCIKTSEELKDDTSFPTYNKSIDVDSIIEAVIEETDSIIETAIEETDSMVKEEN